MIISASRRTDIPSAHADWFFRRLRAGCVLTRNPMNPRQVQRISLRAEDVDGIVFWSKDPSPMLPRLGELEGYAYYFQFTLTGYGKTAEPGLPPVEARVETFRRLADRLGARRVLWRFDPIMITDRFTAEWHVEAFGRLAEALRGYTERATISFVDTYARNRKRLEEAGAQPVPQAEMRKTAAALAQIARNNGMEPVACCEPYDFSDCGVGRASCVDAELLGRIGGAPLRRGKDPNQRAHCGCASSADIGAYNTCPNGCVYCYANYSPALLRANLRAKDDGSPLLCSAPGPEDRIKDRRMESLRESQLKMDFGEDA